ncbi:MAG: RidA family protein [Pseudomonadota bacterium]
MTRFLVSSGSYLEPKIGFSRAVRVGNHVSIAGTAPIPQDGGPTPNGCYEQMKLCLAIAEEALFQAGANMADVVRTRIMLTDIATWEDAARAHGEVFADIRPVTTVVQVTGFVDPAWVVEIEVDAIIP